jgi:hypothetical protein
MRKLIVLGIVVFIAGVAAGFVRGGALAGLVWPPLS